MKKQKNLKKAKLQYLEGIILPTAWDLRGSPAEFSLFTFDEQEFSIASNKFKEGDISLYIRKRVRITFRQNNEQRSPGQITPDKIHDISIPGCHFSIFTEIEFRK